MLYDLFQLSDREHELLLDSGYFPGQDLAALEEATEPFGYNSVLAPLMHTPRATSGTASSAPATSTCGPTGSTPSPTAPPAGCRCGGSSTASWPGSAGLQPGRSTPTSSTTRRHRARRCPRRRRAGCHLPGALHPLPAAGRWARAPYRGGWPSGPAQPALLALRGRVAPLQRRVVLRGHGGPVPLRVPRGAGRGDRDRLGRSRSAGPPTAPARSIRSGRCRCRGGRRPRCRRRCAGGPRSHDRRPRRLSRVPAGALNWAPRRQVRPPPRQGRACGRPGSRRTHRFEADHDPDGARDHQAELSPGVEVMKLGATEGAGLGADDLAAGVLEENRLLVAEVSESFR